MSGASEFSKRIEQLIRDTPERIEGKVKVDQVYAHYQHEHPEFHHPDGGEAFYLKTPLYVKAPQYMQRLADGAITKDGGDLRGAMIDVAEDLSQEVSNRAPWEFADLRASGHPTVVEGEDTVYDRPPHQHRLGPAELKIKHRLSYLLHPNRYKR